MNRRKFLVRTGLALGASLLSGVTSSTCFAGQSADEAFTSWEWVRSQFRLAPDLIHMAGFFLASHPASVRKAIERHRDGLDANPIGYWLEHEQKQEAAVLRAAADYLTVDPTEIALTDSTTMGLGLLYGGLSLAEGQEILTTIHDHYSTDVSLKLMAQRTGAVVRRIALYRDLHRVTRDEIVDGIARSSHSAHADSGGDMGAFRDRIEIAHPAHRRAACGDQCRTDGEGSDPVLCRRGPCIGRGRFPPERGRV